MQSPAESPAQRPSPPQQRRQAQLFQLHSVQHYMRYQFEARRVSEEDEILNWFGRLRSRPVGIILGPRRMLLTSSMQGGRNLNPKSLWRIHAVLAKVVS